MSKFALGMNESDHKPHCAILTTRDGWDADCTCSAIPSDAVLTGKCELCGSAGATLGVDPYLDEVNDDKTPRWLCDACREIRRDDI